MRLTSYLQSARDILQQYKGDVPFAGWLKNVFRENKKFGSRDRKLVADLCFCRFRLGHAFQEKPEEERMLIGQFLCHADSVFITGLKPEWVHLAGAPLSEKIDFLGRDDALKIFPFTAQTSSEIASTAFVSSFLQQPDLFLRLRPGKEKAVVETLRQKGVDFAQEGACLRLSNATKVDELIRLDEQAVVQDKNSQRVLEPLQQQTPNSKPQTFWDCCAASGGKSILLHDTFPAARLTVSDIRESIILNLKNRLRRAGIQHYRSFVADVSAPGFSLPQTFDVIVCDAPCSGSGTWGRTPEQLCFFKKEKIDHYVSLQKSIVANAGKSLKPGGWFLYITCSVFTMENEEVVEHLQQTTSLQLLSQQYFKGYEQKADTLFAALFTASKTT